MQPLVALQPVLCHYAQVQAVDDSVAIEVSVRVCLGNVLQPVGREYCEVQAVYRAVAVDVAWNGDLDPANRLRARSDRSDLNILAVREETLLFRRAELVSARYNSEDDPFEKLDQKSVSDR